MSEFFTFCVPCIPVAQPRAKATASSGHVRMYTPTTRRGSDGTRRSLGIQEFKKALRDFVGAEWRGRAPLTVPVRVDCTFLFPRHQSKMWKHKPMPRYPHGSRPDRDNLDKAVLDALTGLLWVNDWLVWQGTLTKWHCAGDEKPGVILVVRT